MGVCMVIGNKVTGKNATEKMSQFCLGKKVTGKKVTNCLNTINSQSYRITNITNIFNTIIRILHKIRIRYHIK